MSIGMCALFILFVITLGCVTGLIVCTLKSKAAKIFTVVLALILTAGLTNGFLVLCSNL